MPFRKTRMFFHQCTILKLPEKYRCFGVRLQPKTNIENVLYDLRKKAKWLQTQNLIPKSNDTIQVQFCTFIRFCGTNLHTWNGGTNAKWNVSCYLPKSFTLNFSLFRTDLNAMERKARPINTGDERKFPVYF